MFRLDLNLCFAFHPALWQARKDLGGSHEKDTSFFSRCFCFCPGHPTTSARRWRELRISAAVPICLLQLRRPGLLQPTLLYRILSSALLSSVLAPPTVLGWVLSSLLGPTTL